MRLALISLFALIPMTASAQLVQSRPQPAVTAAGVGAVHVAPDRAEVGFGVQHQAATAQKAQAGVNDSMQKVIASLRKLGVPANKISTDRISLFPVYAQQRPGEYDQPPTLVGFRASNSLRVDLALDGKGPSVGSVLDAAITAGANTVEGVSFRIADPTPHEAKALRLAAASARSKASAIAESLGSQLGTLIEASESTGGGGPIQPMMMKMESARDASTSVEAGELTVRATVHVRYALGQ